MAATSASCARVSSIGRTMAGSSIDQFSNASETKVLTGTISRVPFQIISWT